MHFNRMLDETEPPASFKASQVAQALTAQELAALGYINWDEVMPAILELAWELREFGACEILQKGRVLGEDVDLYDVQGGFRIRRKAAMNFSEGLRADDRDPYLQ